MIELLLLSAVLTLAVAALFLEETVPAMIAFALMMLGLGLFYLVQGTALLGLFQIFIYTGGIVVLLLFGITIVGKRFPKHTTNPWAAIVAGGLFVAMTVLWLRHSDTIAPLAKPARFTDGYADTILLFVLIGSSLLYATVRMAGYLRKRPDTQGDRQ